MHRLGRVPPTEAEARYYSQRVTDRPAGSQTLEGAWPGWVQCSHRYPPRRVSHSCRLIDRGSLGHICPLSDGWATTNRSSC